MVLKDDPYCDEASSETGLGPKPGHHQSHRGICWSYWWQTSFQLPTFKIKKREHLLQCGFWMLKSQILAYVFERGGTVTGPTEKQAHNQVGLLEKQPVYVQGPPSSWLLCPDHHARCVPRHDRTMLLSPWTHRIVFLGSRWKQIAAKGPQRSQ